jgi:hypothetical protein
VALLEPADRGTLGSYADQARDLWKTEPRKWLSKLRRSGLRSEADEFEAAYKRLQGVVLRRDDLPPLPTLGDPLKSYPPGVLAVLAHMTEAWRPTLLARSTWAQVGTDGDRWIFRPPTTVTTAADGYVQTDALHICLGTLRTWASRVRDGHMPLPHQPLVTALDGAGLDADGIRALAQQGIGRPLPETVEEPVQPSRIAIDYRVYGQDGDEDEEDVEEPSED